jgi:hypothetical protein
LRHPPFPLAQHAASAGAHDPTGATDPGAQQVSSPAHEPPPSCAAQQIVPAGLQDLAPSSGSPRPRQQTSSAPQQTPSHCRELGQGAHRRAAPGPVASQTRPSQQVCFPWQGWPAPRQRLAAGWTRRSARRLFLSFWRRRRALPLCRFASMSASRAPISTTPISGPSVRRRARTRERARTRSSKREPSTEHPFPVSRRISSRGMACPRPIEVRCKRCYEVVSWQAPRIASVIFTDFFE